MYLDVILELIYNVNIEVLYITNIEYVFISPINKNWGEPGELSQLRVRLLVLAQVMISQFVGSSPTWGSVLSKQSLLGILSLSPSLSAPSPLTLSLKIKK